MNIKGNNKFWDAEKVLELKMYPITNKTISIENIYNCSFYV